MQKFTKINTMYKRYIFKGDDCPNNKWLKMRNKIILGDFSMKEAEYLFNCPWEAYSKIDGTNSKIAYFPSTCEIRVEGKDENSQDQQGLFAYLTAIGERIKPQLMQMYPKEMAKFVPVKNKDTNKVQFYDVHASFDTYDEQTKVAKLEAKFDKKDTITSEGLYGVELEEIPIYIYGEYFGSGIQKCGKRYLKDSHDFAVFDICMQGWWIPKENRDNICKQLGLNQVPYLGVMTLAEIEKKVRAGFTTLYENAEDKTLLEEGIVARPTIPLFASNKERVIVKVKYCDYIDYDRVRSEFTDEEFAEFENWYYANVEAK